MKTILKNFGSIFLVFIMLFAFAVPVFAYNIEMIHDDETYKTYDVYQIFTGDFFNGIFSNVKYGENYIGGNTEEGKPPHEIGDLVDLEELKQIDDAFRFAYLLTKNGNENLINAPIAKLNQSNNFKVKDLPAGYYLVVDNTNSAIIVKVDKNLSMQPKSDTPYLHKNITGENYTDYGKKDNHKSDEVKTDDIINYTLTGKISDNAASYDTYFWVANDRLSISLTCLNDFRITIGDRVLDDNEYNVSINAEDDYITFISIALTPNENNWSEWAGQDVIIEYSAELNENVIVGEEGNSNEAWLVYANNPTYKDQLENGRPNNDTPYNETPIDVVRSYTTGIEIQKIDQNGNPLTGAEFEITGPFGSTIFMGYETYVESETGQYYQLIDGTFTLDEPILEDLMIPVIDSNKFEGFFVVANPDEAEKTIHGVCYRSATEDDFKSGDTLYMYIQENFSLYDSITIKYDRLINYEKRLVDNMSLVDMSTVYAMVNERGTFSIAGMSEGIYRIHESKTPDGYNTIKDFYIKVEYTAPDIENFETNPNCIWNVYYCDAFGNKLEGENIDLLENELGLFELKIENRSGTILPDTGSLGRLFLVGIGTVSMLVGVCFIILYYKKKNNITNN